MVNPSSLHRFAAMLDAISLQPSELLALAAKGAPWAALSYVVYSAVMAVYNLHFHPLAKFPGPRWAAASGWWQVYVELVKQESLSKKLLDLHEEYGAHDPRFARRPLTCAII